ncbi:UNVERIFIED_CONTAM: Retrovirus-related Pol polyprotein from transposon RE2 [Sesamum radiatum]|uniref:Retrovirus-related Pol polyprotein from transposon RE2 n=1 Tax=Sesamum radiatum TaxID=300843 RepID=A0AAW2K9S1_SESRA
MGHDKNTCFKLHGVPEWYKELSDQKRKGNTGTKAYAVQGIELKSHTDTKKEETASVSDIVMEVMRALKHIPNDPIQVNCVNEYADGSTKQVTQSGLVNLFGKLKLTDTLYVPSFRSNLISVHKICATSNIHFLFLPSHCILLDHLTKEIVAVERHLKHLYILDSDSFDSAYISQFISSSPVFVSKVQHIDASLWHMRLGHPSLKVLVHVPHLTSIKSTYICHICPLAKQHRLPFPLSNSQTVKPFDLIHVDIWCPYRQASLSNSRFFVTIVDDYSRGTWIFLMRHKSQVVTFLKNFFSSVHTQFASSVKNIRTDNGLEFLSHECQALFTSLGIHHQKSCPHSPQQNGVVERRHKQLLEIARSLLFQSHLPTTYWGEALLAATYLLNRLPSSVLSWKAPYELLHNKPPSYDHLRVFGCLCFATVTKPHRDKFAKRDTKCLFLGYSCDHKGFKVFDLDTKHIFLSSDVIFHETVFPYQSNSTTSATHSVPLPIVSPTSDTEFTSPSSSIDSSPITDIIPASSSSPFSAPHSTPPSDPPVTLPLRHSTRTSHKPAWLSDFICNHAFDFSPTHIHFAAQLSILQEPRSYVQARGHLEWEKAMAEELQALENNQTWTLTVLLEGKKAIGSRWVYKLKMNPDGSVNRYKARLVAKGYSQIEGVDYTDSFSPVAKIVTVRLFLGIAAAHSWPMHQLDINNAFLHGFLDEEVYMTPLDGYSASPGHVYDILVMAPTEDLIAEIKQYLDALFTIKDLGYAKYFLGLEIARSTEGMSITQHKYAMDIITDTSMISATSVSTPLPPGLKLSATSGTFLKEPDKFRRLIGRLLYLGFTRPGLSFAVQQLSQFLQHPIDQHWTVALHIVRYLKGAPDTGLFFSASDWGACVDSRSSVTGKMQLADIFTKTLPAVSFASLLSKLGLLRLHPALA